jgi:hypothetical protein
MKNDFFGTMMTVLCLLALLFFVLFFGGEGVL